MTTDQANVLAEWVECCARLQQFGESWIESEPGNSSIERVFLLSVSSMLVMQMMHDTNDDSNLPKRISQMNNALARAATKIANELSRET